LSGTDGALLTDRGRSPNLHRARNRGLEIQANHVRDDGMRSEDEFYFNDGAPVGLL